MPEHADDNSAHSSTSAASAMGSIPRFTAQADGTPDPRLFQSSSLQRVALSENAITRAFTPRVPPDVLRELLTGYDFERAQRLISGFSFGFSTGCTDVTEGRASENLPSCLEAPEMVDEYIKKEQQAGRLAGPLPEDYPGIRKISPIGLIPKKIVRCLPCHPPSLLSGWSISQ